VRISRGDVIAPNPSIHSLHFARFLSFSSILFHVFLPIHPEVC